MCIDRFENMKNTFSQTFTINYYPNNPSLPLYSLALLLMSTTSYNYIWLFTYSDFAGECASSLCSHEREESAEQHCIGIVGKIK